MRTWSRRRTLIVLALVFAGGLWLVLSHLNSASDLASSQPATTVKNDKGSTLADLRDKPPCQANEFPLRRDCLPPYLANLPPHPGKEADQTIPGIDSNNDGVRDDVEIYIAENYSFSERTVRALREIARQEQIDLLHPPTTPDEAVEAAIRSWPAISCYVASVDPEVARMRNPLMDVVAAMYNTPERFALFVKHEKLLAGKLVSAPDPRLTIQDLCGYDPTKLFN